MGQERVPELLSISASCCPFALGLRIADVHADSWGSGFASLALGQRLAALPMDGCNQRERAGAKPQWEEVQADQQEQPDEEFWEVRIGQWGDRVGPSEKTLCPRRSGFPSGDSRQAPYHRVGKGQGRRSEPNQEHG